MNTQTAVTVLLVSFFAAMVLAGFNNQKTDAYKYCLDKGNPPAQCEGLLK